MQRSTYGEGLLYGLACYTAWGIFPLYWKMLVHVPAEQILAHRIIWSMVFVLAVLLFLKNRNFLVYLRAPKTLGLLFLTGSLVGSNWFVYILAVNSGHIIESSLGYYMNPLVNVLLGVIFLGERLKKVQLTAVLFALSGVTWLTVHLGRIPWISLYLALSFGFYGLLRKYANLESLPGLMIETLLLSPIAIVFLLSMNMAGKSIFLHHSVPTDLLLILGGPVTALPLFWFGKAATRIPLSTLGFMQYIAPTLALLIGLFIYHETFTTVYFASFALVWIGLAIYTFSLVKDYRMR